MPLTETLYLKTPVWVQNLLCSAEGYRILRDRYGPAFRAALSEAEEHAFLPRDAIIELRDARLRQFITHAARTTHWYRRILADTGLTPNAIRGLGDLRVLPVLAKADVQARIEDFTSSGVPPQDRVLIHTSGTTGTGLRFHSTRTAICEQWAVWWRYRRWHGLQEGTWCAHFGGRSVVPLSRNGPPFWRINAPGRQILFSAYHMNRRNLPACVDALRRRQPPWLHGYPSLLTLIADYLLDAREDLGYAVRWVTTGAESLLPQQADLIQRAFGVRVRQHYGMQEAVANFSECEAGALHVDEDFAAVEFIPCSDRPGVRVVGTNFSNPATPLVRYDTGDIVELEPGGCTCGRPGRVVTRIDGRQEDYIVLSNGARLGRMDHIFKDMVNVREAQIHQRQAGEMTLRIVPGARYTSGDEARLLREARQRVGPDTRIAIEYRDCLARSATGKLRFVVSEVAGAQLTQVGGAGGR